MRNSADVSHDSGFKIPETPKTSMGTYMTFTTSYNTIGAAACQTTSAFVDRNALQLSKQSTTSRHFILPHVDANIQLEPCQYFSGVLHRLSMEDKNDDGDDHTTKDNDDDDEHGNVTTSEGDDDDHDDDDDSEHNLQ